MDHFLREGHYTSAMLLAQSCDIEVIDGSVDRFCAYNLYHNVHVPLYGVYFVGMKSWLPMGWLEEFSSFFCLLFPSLSSASRGCEGISGLPACGGRASLT